MRSPKAVGLSGIRSFCWSPPTQRKLDTTREGRAGGTHKWRLGHAISKRRGYNLGYVKKAKTDRKKRLTHVFQIPRFYRYRYDDVEVDENGYTRSSNRVYK